MEIPEHTSPQMNESHPGQPSSWPPPWPETPEETPKIKPELDLGAISVLRRVLELYFAKWKTFVPLYFLTTVLPCYLAISCAAWFLWNVSNCNTIELGNASSRLTKRQAALLTTFDSTRAPEWMMLTPADVVMHGAKPFDTIEDYRTKTFISQSFAEFGFPFMLLIVSSIALVVGGQFYQAFFYDRIYLDHNGWHESDRSLIRNTLNRNMWVLLVPELALLLLAGWRFLINQSWAASGHSAFDGAGGAMIVIALLVVSPFLYVIYRVSFTFIAMITEQLRFFEAIKRSWHVSRGYFWRTLWVWFVAMLPTSTIGGLLVAVKLSQAAEPFKDIETGFLTSYQFTFYSGITPEVWCLIAVYVMLTIAYTAIRSGVEVLMFSEFARRFDAWKDPVSQAHHHSETIDFNSLPPT